MERTDSFGYLVHRRRKALAPTQTELAQRVSCSLNLIQKICHAPKTGSGAACVKNAYFAEATPHQNAVGQVVITQLAPEPVHGEHHTICPLPFSL